MRVQCIHRESDPRRNPMCQPPVHPVFPTIYPGHVTPCRLQCGFAGARNCPGLVREKLASPLPENGPFDRAERPWHEPLPEEIFYVLPLRYLRTRCTTSKRFATMPAPL